MENMARAQPDMEHWSRSRVEMKKCLDWWIQRRPPSRVPDEVASPSHSWSRDKCSVICLSPSSHWWCTWPNTNIFGTNYNHWTYKVKYGRVDSKRSNRHGNDKDSHFSVFKEGKIKQLIFLLLLQFLFGVDTLDLLLLTLDMTDGIPLWVVQASWPEEQT